MRNRIINRGMQKSAILEERDLPQAPVEKEEKTTQSSVLRPSRTIIPKKVQEAVEEEDEEEEAPQSPLLGRLRSIMPKKVEEAKEEEDEEEEVTQIPRRSRSIPAKVQEAKPENNGNNKTEKKACPYSIPYLCKYLPY